MRETFSTTMDTTTTLTGRKGYFITRNTLFILTGIICCSLLATGIIMYNIASCTEDCTNSIQSASSCAHSQDPGIITAAVTTHSTDSISNAIEDPIENITNVDNHTELPAEKLDVRLPRSVIPISYDIKLIPFLIEDNFTFLGEVKILVKILEDCKNITLHAYSITINDVKLMSVETNESITITDKHIDTAKQFYIIETDVILIKGSVYQIHMKYDGSLNNDLQGFYRSSYKVGNETR